MSIKIIFFNNSMRRSIPKKNIQQALGKIFLDEHCDTASITFIFLDNTEIQKVNKEFLNHDYPTDVISFGLEEDPLEGEIYISTEMAKYNAREYNVSWGEEILRYAVHGALHILGYDDKTDEEKKKMTILEDKYIEYVKV